MFWTLKCPPRTVERGDPRSLSEERMLGLTKEGAGRPLRSPDGFFEGSLRTSPPPTTKTTPTLHSKAAKSHPPITKRT
jgi:hypothetical protein